MAMFKGLLVIVVMSGFLFSCERRDHEGTSVSVTFSSDMICKANGPLKTGDPEPETPCISYNYGGDSLLRLMHYNAGFNCCPEKFIVDIEVKGDSLIISEDELKHGCKCNCLFDLDIKVHNLPAGSYHVRFAEPYVSQSMTKLTFDVDLKKEPSGSFCATRPEGWWR